MTEPAPEVSTTPSELPDDPLSFYCPFIADVPITSFAEPFPIPNPDPRSEQEIEMRRKELRKLLTSKKFNPPLPLADFCLIAKERWDREDSDGSECSVGACLLL